MVTRFRLKQDAEAFCRELEDKHGLDVYHCIYRGHRNWCVRHNNMTYDAKPFNYMEHENKIVKLDN